MRSDQQQKPDMKFASKGGFNIPLQEEYLSSIMDIRRGAAVHRRNINGSTPVPAAASSTQGKTTKIDYKRSFSQGHHQYNHGKRIFFASYFSVESMLLLVCLTASLLLLPLILPPLPPPPFMLLLLPICIMGLLMFLAFMPSSNHVQESTNNYTYL